MVQAFAFKSNSFILFGKEGIFHKGTYNSLMNLAQNAK